MYLRHAKRFAHLSNTGPSLLACAQMDTAESQEQVTSLGGLVEAIRVVAIGPAVGNDPEAATHHVGNVVNHFIPVAVEMDASDATLFLYVEDVTPAPL